jgi:hypothetical protein
MHMSLNITGTSFKNTDGLKYFRKAATELRMGSFGEKKTPIMSANYLQLYSNVKSKYFDDVPVKKTGVVTVDWSSTNWTDVALDGVLKVFGLNVGVAGTYSQEKVKSADCKLFYVYWSTGQVETLLNSYADTARGYLADEGDGRIVNGIWTVVEAKLAEQFDSVGSISVSEESSNLKITASGGKYGTQSIILDPGSTFAYRLAKVTNWSSGKTKVEEVDNDYMA